MINKLYTILGVNECRSDYKENKEYFDNIKESQQRKQYKIDNIIGYTISGIAFAYLFIHILVSLFT